jgi:hypothetical protein
MPCFIAANGGGQTLRRARSGIGQASRVATSADFWRHERSTPLHKGGAVDFTSTDKIRP